MELQSSLESSDPLDCLGGGYKFMEFKEWLMWIPGRVFVWGWDKGEGGKGGGG